MAMSKFTVILSLLSLEFTLVWASYNVHKNLFQCSITVNKELSSTVFFLFFKLLCGHRVNHFRAWSPTPSQPFSIYFFFNIDGLRRSRTVMDLNWCLRRSWTVMGGRRTMEDRGDHAIFQFIKIKSLKR